MMWAFFLSGMVFMYRERELESRLKIFFLEFKKKVLELIFTAFFVIIFTSPELKIIGVQENNRMKNLRSFKTDDNSSNTSFHSASVFLIRFYRCHCSGSYLQESVSMHFCALVRALLSLALIEFVKRWKGNWRMQKVYLLITNKRSKNSSSELHYTNDHGSQLGYHSYQ